jgi:RNA polymerase sigma factor (sigma-70 family)
VIQGETKARVAAETVAGYEHLLKRTARRYSLDGEDVEDAYQRTLEIVLTKAPTSDPQELIRWAQTVIKHEALAVRRNRERLLGVTPVAGQEGMPRDPVAQLPARSDGPDEQVERREQVARTREALQALKPAELRTLTLLAEGYSYAEMAQITGFSLTKINRCLSEGRERFRTVFSSSESGERCRELRPLISAFCDGEAKAADSAAVREHLRACAHCRATMRTYRRAPRLTAALVPALPLSRSLLARAHELLSGFGSKVGAAKQLALCAGAAGAVATGVATGVLPSPVGADGDRGVAPAIERTVRRKPAQRREKGDRRPSRREKAAAKQAHGKPQQEQIEPTSVGTEPPAAVEYEPPVETPPPEPAPVPTPESAASSGSAAGEFGP